MSIRDLINEVKSVGGIFLRQKGSHTIYRLPNGRNYVIPCPNGNKGDINNSYLVRLKRELSYG